MRNKPICFVVMPYGKRPVAGLEIDFDVVFDELIAPAASAAGFEVVRSDRQVVSGVIVPQLFASIYSADLVIADITYQNPNVYYELGVRHALRARGTLLIRREGGDLGVEPLAADRTGASDETAFDIKGVTIYAYRATRDSLPSAVEDLRAQIVRVARSLSHDSPAFLYLEGLRVMTGPPRAHARDDRTCEILNEDGSRTGRFVGYRSGDLRELRDERTVDFWTNSENVSLEMARIYERTVSSTIRWLGGNQPEPALPGFDDTIADALILKRGARNTVDQGEVVVTTSGRLRETHGVKAILHAAVVTAAPGRGFQPIPEDQIIEAARTVMATARKLARGAQLETAGRSLIMPLFGTGQGRLDPSRVAERMLGEAVQDLRYHAAAVRAASPDLSVVLFAAFTRDHVALFQRILDARVAAGELRDVPADASIDA